MLTLHDFSPECVCILGNSGSGKTTLGRKLSNQLSTPLLELDHYVWAPEMPPRMSDDVDIQRDLERDLLTERRFVVEGCYAKWAAVALTRRPLLIFMDMSEAQCIANCLARPWQPEKFASKSAQDRTLPFLLDWVRAYYTRDDDMSRSQHASLFERYDGDKTRIDSLTALSQFLGE